MSSMFSSLVSWDNLWLAYKKAARGKRGSTSVAQFEYQVADRLAELQRDLLARTYQPGPYTHFTIHEPKRRKISASPFRDRVAHHALCNIIEPHFERRFIHDSFANRIGKGAHRATDRLQEFARRFRYVLRMDIVQHFASIDHQILRSAIKQVTPEEAVLWLVDRILASGVGVLVDEYDMVYFPGDDLLACLRPRGLPIGNLTSQFWSNVYMNDFDWWVIQDLRCKAYLRYVDDFALFSDSKAELWHWKDQIVAELGRLRLTAHEGAAQVQRVEDGVPWLGFVIRPSHRLLKQRNKISFARRFQRNYQLLRSGAISFAEFDASAQGWINHVRYADTWRLRQSTLKAGPLISNPRRSRIARRGQRPDVAEEMIAGLRGVVVGAKTGVA